MKNRKGFTLIELLAVILILGIIALIAIPTVNSVIQQSRLGAWESTGNQLAKGLETYYQMCQIRDGKDSAGAACDYNLSDNEVADIKAKLEVKGDIPAKGQYEYFNVDSTGVAIIDFKTTENYYCTNATKTVDNKNTPDDTSDDVTTWSVKGDGSVNCVKQNN